MKSTESNIIRADACISECGKYRYWINRIWDEDKKIGVFVCLNPSRATSLKSDITLSNCNNLAIQWGWGGFYIVNLFAYRATDQSEIKPEEYFVGPKNNEAIKYITEVADQVVIAWGSSHKKRANEVLESLKGKQLYCLEQNKSEGYRHPGRIKVEDYLEPRLI